MTTEPHRKHARRAAIALGLAVSAAPAVASADPLRLRADAYAQTTSPVGLLVLRGADQEKPWLDAEAVAWLGVRDTPDVTGDALTLTVRVHDPKGRGEIRVGRFVYSAGAIRPIHIDGLRAIGRLKETGTNLEVFGGSPVVPRFAARPFDVAMGGRMSQNFGDILSVGGAYIVRHRDREMLDQEVGPDLAFSPTKWFDLSARSAFDLVNRGPTDALASLGLRSTDFRVEAFVTHRSPARMLPATSLFSVLGDIPNTSTGGTIRYRIAPRLETVLTMAMMKAGTEFGAYGTGRAILALDDAFAGSLGLELRRQVFDTARWSGIRGIVTLPLSAALHVSTELELVRPDTPPRGHRVWPWALLAVSHRWTSGWEAAVGVEALGTRDDRSELHAMARVSYAFGRFQ